MLRLAMLVQIFGILFVCLFVAVIILSWLGVLTPGSLFPQ